jgi:hypothetical protein
VAGGLVITAAGEIDSYTAPGLQDALQTATQNSSRVISDLTDVTVIGSTVPVSSWWCALRPGRQVGWCPLSAPRFPCAACCA